MRNDRTLLHRLIWLRGMGVIGGGSSGAVVTVDGESPLSLPNAKAGLLRSLLQRGKCPEKPDKLRFGTEGNGPEILRQGFPERPKAGKIIVRGEGTQQIAQGRIRTERKIHRSVRVFPAGQYPYPAPWPQGATEQIPVLQIGFHMRAGSRRSRLLPDKRRPPSRRIIVCCR